MKTVTHCSNGFYELASLFITYIFICKITIAITVIRQLTIVVNNPQFYAQKRNLLIYL
jgi:hypothetical protein